MTDRKRQALRNLAERPGTPAEGEVARAMLAKLEAKRSGLAELSDLFIKAARKHCGEELSEEDMDAIFQEIDADLAERLRKAHDDMIMKFYK